MSKQAAAEATPEMRKYFEERTDRHIRLVGKYCNLIADAFPEFEELRERAKVHDASKYESPEYEPYLWITWKYKCRDEGKEFDVPEEISARMNEATLHHVTSNSHHPEYHSPKKTGLINRENRDKPPAEIVDATKMPRLDVAEMCADWLAMGAEKGNSAKSWADKNVNVRWEFTDEQEVLIYELISYVEDEDGQG